MKNLFIFIFSIVFVIACSTNDNQTPTIKIPPQTTPEERFDFALRFMLLDNNGNKNPPAVEQKNAWPLGALISFKSKTNLGYCSISHIEKGKILTNAHCITPGLEPEKYYAIFYNKYGVKDLASITKIEYVGNHQKPDLNDIAILTISNEDADRWHNTSNQVQEVKNVNLEPPAAQEIVLWSFDPIQNWPQYIRKWKNEYGMVFKPNECLGSYTLPHLVDVYASGQVTINSDFSGEKHLIIDSCKHEIVKGNSGSLVTLKNDFDTLLATAFSVVPMQPTAYGKPQVIHYGGNKRTKEGGIIAYSYQEGRMLYAAGLSIDYYNKKLKPR